MQGDNPASVVHAHSRTQFLEQTVHQISLVFYIAYFVLSTMSFKSVLMPLVCTLLLRLLSTPEGVAHKCSFLQDNDSKDCPDFYLYYTHFPTTIPWDEIYK